MKFNFVSLLLLIIAIICGILGYKFKNNKIIMVIGLICLFGGIISWVITGKL